MAENIRVFTQNSIRIESAQGAIYIDTFKMNEAPHDAEYILITHDHYDHFSPEDIEKVANENTILVVPEKMRSKADKISGMVKRIETVSPGIMTEIDGLGIEAVPSYNILKPFHPKGAGWVGYILNTDGERIYIAGDTDLTKEAKEVKCDIALIPIGGTYTMDAKKAAELVNIIKPKIVIPTHYGSIVGTAKDAADFVKLVDESIDVKIIME